MDNSTSTEIVMYGTSWCYDTRRARAVLERNNIPYRYIDIDSDPLGRKIVEKINRGMRSVPTITFPDGSILVEPSDAELTSKIGVKQAI
jgi:mycoredoxin